MTKAQNVNAVRAGTKRWLEVDRWIGQSDWRERDKAIGGWVGSDQKIA